MSREEESVASAGSARTNSFRFSTAVKYYFSISVLGLLIFTLLFAVFAQLTMALMSAGCALGFLLFFILDRKTNASVWFYAGVLLAAVYSGISIYFAGWMSGYILMLLVILPFLFMDEGLKKIYRSLLLLLLGLTPIFLWIFFSQKSAGNTSVDLQRWLFAANFLYAVILLAVEGYLFASAATDAEKALIAANKRLTGLATLDPATNLLNRRAMMNKIEKEKERMQRVGKPFALIMADIDDFNQVNQKFGPECCDMVLPVLAERLNLCLRKQDEVARWGCDEFLILLPETDLVGGQNVATKVLAKVTAPPFFCQDHEIPITLTMGVGICYAESEPGDCIRSVEKALTIGKNSGKNRIELAER